MDFARKIGKTNDPKKWERKPTTMVMSTDCKITSNAESIKEDHRLQNWKKWLAERRKIGYRIKSLTGREHTDQVINSCEKVRSLIETKIVMENASIPVPVIPDKYRGSPEFWNIPLSLPNRRDPCLPEITAVPSKRAMNLPPDLAYVDVPEVIEHEKGLKDISLKKTRWERSSYLKQREKDLEKEIKLVMPKKPETKNLIILGKTFQEPEECPPIPVISITTLEEEDLVDDPNLAIILKIQDREIVWKRSLFESDTPDQEPIQFDLKYHGTVDQRMEQKITFENKGNVVIRYYWRNSSFRSNHLTFQKRVSPFYFNKTEGMILQGQIIELKIWYLPRSTSIFTESWRLFTDPKLCHSPLIFRLWGCADTPKDDLSCSPHISTIDLYLDRCIRDSTIREILQSIMAKISHKKPPEPAYSSLFLESDIFNAKNPYHYYHPNIVLELHKLYREVVDRSAPPWTLSLEDLRGLLLLIKKFDRRQQLLVRFNDLYKECLKPTLNLTFVNDRKYSAIYNLLCSFANRFELESDFAITSCKFKEDKTINVDSDSLISLSSLESSSRQRKGTRNVNSDLSITEAKESSVSLVQKDCSQPYKEAFFVRIYELLVETMERVFAAIDSLNNLEKEDK